MRTLTALCLARIALTDSFVSRHATRRCALRAAPEAGEELEALWRAHSTPLVRVGKGGVKQSHRNSLLELLDVHGNVCVKINGARDADAVAAAAEALAGEGAVVLLTKSNSVLYGKPGGSLASSVPGTKTLKIEESRIGLLIGKGGETVRGLIADFGLADVKVGDDSAVTITGTDRDRMDACAARIEELTAGDAQPLFIEVDGRKQRATPPKRVKPKPTPTEAPDAEEEGDE